MTEQTSRLAIIIDSTGAEKNADNLATALGRMTQAGQNAATGAGRVKKASEEEASALSSLLDRIDPVNAALNKLDSQQKELAKFKAKGFIDTDTFDAYSKKIEDSRGRLTGFSDQLSKTGMSAKQTAAAMRMVPAQMTDIIVSLQGGQAPLTVLLQQGGQLKDMFGGIVPAAKALGGYVAGLINPFTLAAAAAGVLGLAYYKGSQEQSAFNESLILTGNLVGKTSGQMALMASNVASATKTTTGNASSVLNQLVSTSKVAGDSLQTAASAIVNINKETGIATDQLVTDFGKLAKDPVSAIAELNDKYNFLTVATYRQIKALQEEGNTQEATRVATEAYANTLNTRATQIHTSLGTLESAWNSITEAAKGAWDAMLDVGRKNTPEQSLKELSDRIAEAQKAQSEGGIWNNFNSKFINLDAMIKARDELQSQVTTQNALNESIDGYNKRQQERIKIQQEADKSGQQYQTNAELRANAIQKESEFLKEGAISADEYAKRVSRINERYKDPKEKAYTEDAATRLLDQINQQNTAMRSQLVFSDRLNSATQSRIKFEQQIADLKSKSQLTADQKSILARSDEILQAYKQQEALQNSVKTLDDYRKMQDEVKSAEEKTLSITKQRVELLERARASGSIPEADLQRTGENISRASITTAPSFSGVAAAVGGAGGELVRVAEAQKKLDEWNRLELDKQQQLLNQKVINEQTYANRVAEINATNYQKMQDIQYGYTTASLSMFSDMTGQAASLLQGMGKDGSAAYKTLFLASKASAMAQAYISTEVAAMKALELGPILGIPASTAIRMMGYASIAMIGAQTIAGMAHSGIDSVPQTGTWLLQKGERVVTSQTSAKLDATLESLRKNGLDATLSRPGYGTGATNVSNSNANTTVFSPNVNVSNSFSGKPDDATLIAINQSNKRLAKQIKDELTAEIIKPQGNFGNALKGYYARGYVK